MGIRIHIVDGQNAISNRYSITWHAAQTIDEYAFCIADFVKHLVTNKVEKLRFFEL